MWGSRPSDQPLMLIYVIDKNSKAESSNREDLFEDGKGEHVVAVSIALPEADIPQSEIEAEREMWSNAFRPPMPDEEE